MRQVPLIESFFLAASNPELAYKCLLKKREIANRIAKEIENRRLQSGAKIKSLFSSKSYGYHCIAQNNVVRFRANGRLEIVDAERANSSYFAPSPLLSLAIAKPRLVVKNVKKISIGGGCGIIAALGDGALISITDQIAVEIKISGVDTAFVKSIVTGGQFVAAIISKNGDCTGIKYDVGNGPQCPWQKINTTNLPKNPRSISITTAPEYSFHFEYWHVFAAITANQKLRICHELGQNTIEIRGTPKAIIRCSEYASFVLATAPNKQKLAFLLKFDQLQEFEGYNGDFYREIGRGTSGVQNPNFAFKSKRGKIYTIQKHRDFWSMAELGGNPHRVHEKLRKLPKVILPEKPRLYEINLGAEAKKTKQMFVHKSQILKTNLD